MNDDRANQPEEQPPDPTEGMSFLAARSIKVFAPTEWDDEKAERLLPLLNEVLDSTAELAAASTQLQLVKSEQDAGLQLYDVVSELASLTTYIYIVRDGNGLEVARCWQESDANHISNLLNEELIVSRTSQGRTEGSSDLKFIVEE